MIRAAASSIATLLALAGAWAAWPLLGMAVQRLGLGAFDPLAAVVLGFAALSLVDAILIRLIHHVLPDNEEPER